MHSVSLLAIFGLVFAKKQAVYSSNYSLAYLLSDETLYTLVLSGKQESSDTLSKELKQIQAPPSTDSSLVIDSNDNLYSIYGSGCGSTIDLQSYNATSNSWSSLESSQTGWHNTNSTCWYDSTTDSILIYGGVGCDNTISQDFYQYNVGKKEWSTASANPMPREMAYSSSISISKDSTLLLGGRTNDGWLSMQQVAIWQYGGWSYWPITNFTGIDSRDDPFLLPMWNNSESNVDSILVVGGTVANRDASPSVLALRFDQSNGWHWTSASIPDANVLLTVYNSVYSNNAIYATSGKQQDSVAPAKLSSANTTTAKKGLNVGSIAALSTIIPLFFIICGCVAAWLWWRRRRQRTVFQPRRSQLVDNHSVDMDNFSSFQYPPVREKERKAHHEKEKSHSEYQQSDIQFLVNRNSTHLRVVNPDIAEESSLSSFNTLTSESGALIKENQSLRSFSSSQTEGSIPEPGLYRHRATGSVDITEMRRTGVSSRSSSDNRKAARRDVSNTSFDFTDNRS